MKFNALYRVELTKEFIVNKDGITITNYTGAPCLFYLGFPQTIYVFEQVLNLLLHLIFSSFLKFSFHLLPCCTPVFISEGMTRDL